MLKEYIGALFSNLFRNDMKSKDGISMTKIETAKIERAKIERAKIERAKIERTKIERAKIERAKIKRALVNKDGKRLTKLRYTDTGEIVIVDTWDRKVFDELMTNERPIEVIGYAYEEDPE